MSANRFRCEYKYDNLFTKKDFLHKANYDALRFISNEMLQDTNQFVPKRTGRLRKNGVVENLTKDGFELVWHRQILKKDGTLEKNAAELLYEGINPETDNPVKNWTTKAPDGSDAGGNWVEKSKAFYLSTWQGKYKKSFTESFRKHK